MTYPIRIDHPPTPRPRMTRRDKWQKRPCVMRYRRFCDMVRRAVDGADLPARVGLTFVVQMPKSWPKYRKNEHAGQPHQQKPDVDNYVKGLLDAWDEDEHVHEVRASKRWARHDEMPHVIIENLGD